jgi:SAM-dependent methyltransferase
MNKSPGVDLTPESVARVRTRLTLRELPFEELRQGSVLELPFADGSFDMVLSHGVLHHVPEIAQPQKEIHRVLRPGSELVIMMVYARWSLNYLMSIALIRRAALLAAYPPGPRGSGEVRSVCGNPGRSSQKRQAFHARTALPVHRLPGEELMGWDLWVHMKPKADGIP